MAVKWIKVCVAKVLPSSLHLIDRVIRKMRSSQLINHCNHRQGSWTTRTTGPAASPSNHSRARIKKHNAFLIHPTAKTPLLSNNSIKYRLTVLYVLKKLNPCRKLTKNALARNARKNWFRFWKNSVMTLIKTLIL